MAQRPAFIARKGVVVPYNVNFEWFPGFSVVQKQRSVAAMHNALPGAALEVSTKSTSELGRSLSAFVLKLNNQSLESVFQGSKVFENGGPYTDMYSMWPRDAKHDPRLKNSGALKAFEYEGVRWELEPKTAFYDYLYVRAVKQSVNSETLKGLMDYRFFTDIEFNPLRSINTQARAIVLVKLLLEEFGEIPEFTPQEWVKWHVCHVFKV